MGWAGGTEIFDGVVDLIISRIIDDKGLNVPEALVRDIVRDVYTKIDWGDWDTQDESKYFEDYLFGVMVELGEADPEDY